ncbi:rho GTPase-activating protein 26-like [Centruroides sculpturatus]|uniref:rho GTPase-activating protein 26-like n=1 Tax=Centruroides sculpturatus TaxID=218467 RepID=UPI000C6E0FA5|nr:rho GTPase-activating protein 26-like [Centruroides sculpturatus]
MNFGNAEDYEIKTITSALKSYFRNLPEPLMTFRLHSAFITAAKNENKIQRINLIHSLVHKLPKNNFNMLNMLIKHLCKIAQYSDKNLMTVSNLGVCFGPTLLKPEIETMAAIMDIKFGNVVVEILIENYDKIFSTVPENHKRPDLPYYSSPNAVNQSSNYIPLPHQESMHNIRKSNMDSMDQSLESARVQNIPKIHYSNVCSSCPSPYLNDGNYSSQRGMLAHPAYVVSPTQPLPVNHSGSQSHSVQSHIPVDRGRSVAVFNPVWNDNHSPSGASSTESLSNPQAVSHTVNNSNRTHSAQVSSRMTTSLGNHSVYIPSDKIHGTERTEYPQNNIKENFDLQELHVRNTQEHYINSGIPNSGITAKTLYACVGENESELSFQPNEIIYNLRTSNEQGWLIGIINGREGMIPANYVELL